MLISASGVTLKNEVRTTKVNWICSINEDKKHIKFHYRDFEEKVHT